MLESGLLFDNAAGTAAKNDWSGALDGYAAIVKRLGPNGKPGRLGLVRVRKGETLCRLSRFEDPRLSCALAFGA